MKRLLLLSAAGLTVAAAVSAPAIAAQTTAPDPFVGIATSGLVPPVAFPPLSGPVPQEAGPLPASEWDVAVVAVACGGAAYMIAPYLWYGLAMLTRSEHIYAFGQSVGPVVGAIAGAVACGEVRRRNR